MLTLTLNEDVEVLIASCGNGRSRLLSIRDSSRKLFEIMFGFAASLAFGTPFNLTLPRR